MSDRQEQSDIQLFLDELDSELTRKNLPKRDRMLFRGMKYLIVENLSQREDMAILKKHDMIQRAKEYPKAAVFSIIILFSANWGTMEVLKRNWATVGRPVLQVILYKATGILYSLDVLP